MNAKPIQELQPLTSTGPNGATVYIETFGCQMNVYDSSAILGLLEQIGLARDDDPNTADVVLINTCSVRDHAEHRVLSRVGELRAQRAEAGNPPAIMGICGCMAERLGKKLTQGRQRVDLVVGVDAYDALPGLVAERLGDRALELGAIRDQRVAASQEAFMAALTGA